MTDELLRDAPHSLAQRILHPAQVVPANSVRPQYVGRSPLAENYDAAALSLALNIRKFPHLYLRRITDRLTVDGSRLLQELTYELKINNEVDPGCLVVLPLSTGKRSEISDDSNAEVSSGRARRLTSDEERELTALIIESAYVRIFDGTTLPARFPSEYRTHLENLRRIPYSPPDACTLAIAKALKWIKSVGADLKYANIDELVRTSSVYTTDNIIAIACRVSEDYLLTVVRKTDQAQQDVRRVRWHKTRRLLGRNPYIVETRITDVTDAGSYHVFLKTPPGHHVHRIQVLSPPNRDSIGGPVGTFHPLPRELYRSAGVGTNQMHVYFHPSNSGERDRLRKLGVLVRVHLGENLPGSMVTAWVPTVLLFVALLLTIADARSILPIHAVKGTASLSSAFPAFFLTLPGIGALLFRPQDDDAAVNAPMVSAVAPIINSLASFGMALAYLAAVLRARHNHRIFMGFSWLVLVLVGVLLAYLTFRIVRKLKMELPDCGQL